MTRISTAKTARISVRSFFGSATMVATGMHLLFTPGVFAFLFSSHEAAVVQRTQFDAARGAGYVFDGYTNRDKLSMSLPPQQCSTGGIDNRSPDAAYCANNAPVDRSLPGYAEGYSVTVHPVPIVPAMKVPLPRKRPASAPSRKGTAAPKAVQPPAGHVLQPLPLVESPQEPAVPMVRANPSISSPPDDVTPLRVPTPPRNLTPRGDNQASPAGLVNLPVSTPVKDQPNPENAINYSFLQLAVGIAILLIGLASLVVNVVNALVGPDIRAWLVARRQKRQVLLQQVQEQPLPTSGEPPARA
jgi:hypothetical protein